MTNFSKVLTKFAISQHLYRGLVVSLGVLLPCLLLEHFGVFGKMVALPTGTLMVSLTDSPGPHKRRLNTLLISIAVYFFVAITTCFLRHFPGIIFLLLIFYGLFFSLIGVFGTRATTIGTTALLIFVFNLDDHLSQGQYVESALYFLAGGVWYLIIFFTLDWLKPYIIIEQLMSEYLYEIGNYLSLKAEFYQHDPDAELVNTKLLASQTLIRTQQDELREILFKTRAMVRESTPKGRALMVIFLDSIELFERIMTTQYDYTRLKKILPDSHVVPFFGGYIVRLAHELEKIALSLPLEKTLPENSKLDNAYKKCENLFEKLRNENLNADTIEDFIMLRQILNSLKDLTARIKNIRNATNYNKAKQDHDVRLDSNLNKFTPKDSYKIQLLKDNLSLESSHFRHAIRVTVALLAGYIISLFMPVGHAYWMLLTIVVLLKPSYSISRQRNLYRLGGTLIGIAIGFTAIYFIHSDMALFVLLAVFMVFGYSMLKINYMLATTGITVFIILAYTFINPSGIRSMLIDRIVDTLVACIIVWLTALFILPVWEESQIGKFIKNTIKSNLDYFTTTSQLLISKDKYNDEKFRLARKSAFIQLGNLSDLFQRMLTEPKAKQLKVRQLHQFVTTSHMMTSYIASLSYYSHTFTNTFDKTYLQSIIQQIREEFTNTLELVNSHNNQYKIAPTATLPDNLELQNLYHMRRQEIDTEGIDHSAIGKKLSSLNALQSLLELINNNIIEQNHIASKLIEN